MVSEIFGSRVFNLATMKAKLPNDVYKKMRAIIKDGVPFDPSIADTVANAMKVWAIENGCTHYTHIFQPMTVSLTAEKHDSFIDPDDEGGVIEKFSGKSLLGGEPDGSSFPSGGIRETCAARGYTAWDPTSYAYVKDGSLYIPTAFFSYTGEALDRKAPLLRSQDAISKQALRVLKYFNTDATRVVSYVGPEQEYFIIDGDDYLAREDLRLTGRTLFGAFSPRGQELDDHYFGVLKSRIAAFMEDLDAELWRYGIHATTKHNEVAPAQHEIAPVFSTTTISTDTNLLTMEILKKVAQKHNLVCILHEKPFEGVNGSGKHNNWSIGTNKGENLLDPGDDPMSNKQFMLVLAAIIKAVDTYADVLRASAASAGNDHRLGANEAPPAIVSVYLGDQLDKCVLAYKEGKTQIDDKVSYLETGVQSLPTLKKDCTDRNRTSPFAFTGNRFEFRMPGSSQSIADVNMTINTIIADAFCDFADALDASEDIEKTIDELISDTFKKHERIIFNGDGYSKEWPVEAAKRGLANNKTTPEALMALTKDTTKALFAKHGVLTNAELAARYEVFLEEYAKLLNIEAKTTVDMAKKEILPSCLEYTKSVVDGIIAKKSIGINVPEEQKNAAELSELTEELIKNTAALDSVIAAVPGGNADTTARYFTDTVIPAMGKVREVADALEVRVGRDYWPFPTYADLLYDVM